jgi:hypothetical protein
LGHIRIYGITQFYQESHADGPDNDNANADDDQFMNPIPVCQKLASASAMSLWVKNIDHILAAGKQPGDSNFNLQDVTAEVLKLITPRLPLSPRSSTRDWEKVEHLLNKVYKYARYRYIQYIQDDTKKEKEGHNDPPSSPFKDCCHGWVCYDGHQLLYQCEKGQYWTMRLAFKTSSID